ncbi:hypothetical protein KSP40_PGU021864 [Platanthera guangdongensis]|uniref:Uncharacterized protein n=1 Tax=Platanthera guangdongensis TaxID=2320717 RepID=A0ABR2MDG7_9ASPA
MALASSSDVYISDTYDSALGKNCNGTSFDVSEIVISAFDSSIENPILIKDDLVAVNPLSKTLEHPLELVCKNESRGLTTGSKLCASEPSHLTPHNPFCRDCIPEDAIFQGVAKDSLPEVGSSGSSGRGVEDVDLNLAGQELAKSMMAFLLPQAVPLIKKTYVRRRSRIRLLKAIDPYCTLNSVNTPVPNAVNDHQGTDIVAARGKLLSGTLPQLPENTILKSIDASKLSSQAAGFTEFNLYLANEPFSGDRSSKDPMTVIPDSFENDMCSYDASMKEQRFTGFDEPDLALQDNVKGNSDTSSLPITVVEEVNKLLKFFSQNDANNQEFVTPDKKDGLVNSIISVVQPAKHILTAEETNEESIKNIEKYSNNLTGTFSSLDATFFLQNSFQRFNHESEHNSEEISFQVSPGKCPNKDNFEQNPPGPCHILKNLNDNDVSKEFFGRCETFRPTKEKSGSFCPVGAVNFDMHKNNKVEQIREDNHSLPCLPKYALVTEGIPVDTIEAQNCNSMLSVPCNVPLSETILCRNLNNSNASDMNISRKSTFTAENYHSNRINHNADSSTPSVYEAEIDEPTNKLRNDPYASELESNWIIAAAVAFQSQDLDRNATRSIEVTNETDNAHKDLSHCVFYKESLFDGSLPRELYDGGRFMELVGCYCHPEPILSVTLSTNMNQLQLSVLCGFPEATNRILFMYSVSLQKLRGCPTFLGYTPLLLPAVRDRWNINIPFERSALQLTPDQQFLIFFSSIKAPRCRERKISCLCSNCKAESSAGMTIEIVRVNFGYVSRMTKLTTASKISCISVCEPSYLIAVEEDGRLHTWVMNLTWSEHLEEFMLPTLDCVSPRILELRGMPNCNSLIVGHNGLGDFGLWELSKRVLLAKFSSPKSTIYQIIPVYVFNWQMNSTFSTSLQSADHNMHIMHQTDYKILLGSSFENIAIWILISATDIASETEVKGLGIDHTGFWRLALMTKNTLIMGNSLDPRATAVDASANNGIIGTSDGLFYKWELSSGRKLGNLTSIKCGVSCVALDGKTGAAAVAGRDGRLQVFV